MRRLFRDRTTVLFFLGMAVVYLYWSPIEKPFEHLIGAITSGWAVVFLFGAVVSLTGTAIYNIISPWRRHRSERIISAKVDDNTITGLLKRKGFRVKVKDGDIVADKGKVSFLPGFLVRTGLAGLLLCLFFSTHMRRSTEVYLSEGDMVNVFGNRFRVKALELPLPEDILIVGEKEGFRIKKLKVVLEGQNGEAEFDNGLPEAVEGLYFVPIEVGYGHSLVIKRNGRVASQQVFLEVLPPGKAHLVKTTFRDLLLSFKLHPERTIKKGLFTGRVYNLQKPTYEVTVQMTKMAKRPEKVILKPAEKFSRAGVSITLGPGVPFLKALVVKDPMVIPGYMSMVVLLVGLLLMPLRLIWFRQRILATKTEQGWRLALLRDQYARWSEPALEEIIQEIGPYE